MSKRDSSRETVTIPIEVAREYGLLPMAEERRNLPEVYRRGGELAVPQDYVEYPEERRRSLARMAGRGALKLAWGTAKTPFKMTWGALEFGWAARKNTLGGHTRKVVGGLALAGIAWVGHNDHEPATDKHNTVQMATVEIGTPSSALGEKAAVTKNFLRGVVDGVTFHHMFDDNRSLSEVADWLSEDRGYYIPVERLVALNQNSKFIQHDSDGKYEDRLNVDLTKGAIVQFKVPGPIYGGYDVVDESKQSLESFSKDTLRSISDLRQWNPGLAKYENDQELPQGTLIQIAPTIDQRLVLRKMTKDEGSGRELLHKFHALQEEITLANGPITGSGEYAPDSPGKLGYFPLVGSQEKKNKQHFTAAQISAAFSTEGAPIDVSGSQVSGKKKPPRTPKPTQKPPADKPVAPIEDNKGREHININKEGLKPDQAAIVQTIVDTAYNLDIPDGDKYRAAVIGLITARVESNIHNMKGGDRDSVGVMQQRGGWGTYAQRHDVQWAINAFYNGGSKAHDGYSEPGLLDIRNWQDMSYGDAAQKVQKSAFPDRYAEHVSEAKKILRG